MSDILKIILDELPKGVSSANFEGANIVLYTADKNFFLTSDEKIRELVNKIKKRVELRASLDILADKDFTKKAIHELIPKEAEVEERQRPGWLCGLLGGGRHALTQRLAARRPGPR